MAAEVIPPQMSKVNGIIRIEIMTTINKRSPLIPKLSFYMTSSHTVQLNQGDPMCCGHPQS